MRLLGSWPAASDASSSHRARWCRCRRRHQVPMLSAPPLSGLPGHLLLTGGWRWPPFAGAGGGRYLIYRPGWTLFHLPSTPWAPQSRPIPILRSGLNRGASTQTLFLEPAGNSRCKRDARGAPWPAGSHCRRRRRRRRRGTAAGAVRRTASSGTTIIIFSQVSRPAAATCAEACAP